MSHDEVPDKGPLSIGSIYKRADLHSRFGGNRVAGIVPCVDEPLVLLFHTEEPAQPFYRDGFADDGLYWYSGEGASGEMKWTAANRAIKDHTQDGKSILFFERAQRRGGLWRFLYVVQCADHKTERRVDKSGNLRKVIVFGLRPVAQAR